MKRGFLIYSDYIINLNNMKKILPVIIVIILLILGFYLFSNKGQQAGNKILGDQISLIDYNNGNGGLIIEFLSSKNDRYQLSLAVDNNNDQLFDESEWLLEDMMVLPKDGHKNKVYFKAPENFSGNQHVLVKLGDETLDTTVSVTSSDLSSLMDLDSITNPEEAMKGLGVNVALAQEVIEITQDDVPDIDQKPGECAPTAAANGLISLINKKGNQDDLPASPEELIEELKEDMNWDREDGVQPDNFVEGKNRWALRHGLPIRTTKVGDTHGIETIDQIREALEQGASVELRIKFGDASGKAAGGHMVTVTGIHQGDGQTYLDINDPYTPEEEGSETVEVRSNQITNYGPWEGLTVLSWGFIQVWETPLNSGTSLDPMTDTEVEGLIGEFGGEISAATIETSFAHVKPGEYSEVYAAVHVSPGTEVCLSLTGPGVSDSKTKVVVADDNGQAYFTWKIVSYGTYNVSGACGDVDVSGTVVVN